MGHYHDLETKKSLHVNLTKETHAALRITSFQYHLSMQEIFEELARQVVEGEPYMQKTLEDMQFRKRTRTSRQFSQTDAESIFRVIEDANPIGNAD